MESLKKLMVEDARLTEEALLEYYSETDEDLALILDAEKYSLFAGGKRISSQLRKERNCFREWHQALPPRHALR